MHDFVHDHQKPTRSTSGEVHRRHRGRSTSDECDRVRWSTRVSLRGVGDFGDVGGEAVGEGLPVEGGHRRALRDDVGEQFAYEL